MASEPPEWLAGTGPMHWLEPWSPSDDAHEAHLMGGMHPIRQQCG